MSRLARFGRKVAARRLFEKCVLLQQFNACCLASFGAREELLAQPQFELTRRFQQALEKHYPRGRPKTRHCRQVLEAKFRAL